jgi:hypothetical protein
MNSVHQNRTTLARELLRSDWPSVGVWAAAIVLVLASTGTAAQDKSAGSKPVTTLPPSRR